MAHKTHGLFAVFAVVFSMREVFVLFGCKFWFEHFVIVSFFKQVKMSGLQQPKGWKHSAQQVYYTFIVFLGLR